MDHFKATLARHYMVMHGLSKYAKRVHLLWRQKWRKMTGILVYPDYPTAPITLYWPQILYSIANILKCVESKNRCSVVVFRVSTELWLLYIQWYRRSDHVFALWFRIHKTTQRWTVLWQVFCLSINHKKLLQTTYFDCSHRLYVDIFWIASGVAGTPWAAEASPVS